MASVINALREGRVPRERMTLDIGKELAKLKQMTVRELREKYEQIFGEPTRGREQGLPVQADRVADSVAGRG